MPINRKPSSNRVHQDHPHTSSVWEYTHEETNEIDQRPSSAVSITPTLDKCDKHRRPQAICCRDLKGDDDRHLIDPDIVRDIIIGLSDGLTVPFGLTAGLSSLGSSRLVVVGGIAELISGAISMGVGGYLASEAERDHFRYLQRTTRERVARSCSGEMEREVHEVLGPIGLDESISRKVTGALLRVESEMNQINEPLQSESWLRGLMKIVARQPKSNLSNESGSSQLRWSKDVGVTAFLLKFGEGLEEVPESRLYISALTIGTAYFIGGLVPMAPYFFIESAQIALYWSIGIMFITLLIFGVFKAYFTGAKIGFFGYLKASSATIVVGGSAAAASWLIVKALEKP
ncbi:VIT family-domain-containing protein [Melampsora americana]|nr:VIT family-domain-containing protein [Melampsora americana]